MVLAEDWSAFSATYGAGIPVTAELGGHLPSSGTITLSSQAQILSKVKYEAVAPWPIPSDPRNSLQVNDPSADIARVSNWTAGERATPGAPNPASYPVLTYPLLWLNELQPRNDGSVRDNYQEADPWVELFNSSPNVIPLWGSYLTDDYSNLTKYPLPNISLPPGALLVIWTDGQTQQTSGSNLHANFRLSSTGGALALVTPGLGGPRIVDYINYPAVEMGRSYGSFPNGQLFYREVLGSTTPGSLNRPPPIFINEWMASNGGLVPDPADGDADDWFELYNQDSQARDLSGYLLSDGSQGFHAIPTGTIIPARGYLVVWADNELSQNSPARKDIHMPFALRAKGDSIFLRAPDGSPVDAVSFGKQNSNISEGRWPDGSANKRVLSIPSPGASNRVINVAAPVLSTIPDQILTLGQTLDLPIQAADADSAFLFLTYSIQTGPPGAVIVPNNLFHWTPSPGQAPTTNSVTIQVSDDGIPPLVGRTTFQVIVVPPPTLALAQGVGNNASLKFATIPGRGYQVEYKNHLQDPIWTTLPAVTNSTSSVTVPLSVGQNQQIFLRVRVLN